MIPINCPICNKVLNINKYQFCELLECISIDHSLKYTVKLNEITSIDLKSYLFYTTYSFCWYFDRNILYADLKRLPFFIPDFSNFSKLIEKLKTILLFS